jgi:hypothetical protein
LLLLLRHAPSELKGKRPQKEEKKERSEGEID